MLGSPQSRIEGVWHIEGPEDHPGDAPESHLLTVPCLQQRECIATPKAAQWPQSGGGAGEGVLELQCGNHGIRLLKGLASKSTEA